jgi:hypothetical protein
MSTACNNNCGNLIHLTSHHIIVVYRDNAAQFLFHTCPHSLHATHCAILIIHLTHHITSHHCLCIDNVLLNFVSHMSTITACNTLYNLTPHITSHHCLCIGITSSILFHSPHSMHATHCIILIHLTSHHITSLLCIGYAQFCFTCPQSLHATHCAIYSPSHHITSLLLCIGITLLNFVSHVHTHCMQHTVQFNSPLYITATHCCV